MILELEVHNLFTKEKDSLFRCPSLAVIVTAGGHDRIDDCGETSPDMMTAVAAGASSPEAHMSASMVSMSTNGCRHVSATQTLPVDMATMATGLLVVFRCSIVRTTE